MKMVCMVLLIQLEKKSFLLSIHTLPDTPIIEYNDEKLYDVE